MTRTALAARIIIPALWLGLIIGISLIEAPLKFTAPGITIPLGLGIGRLVFGAMNIVEAVLAILLVAASLARPRLPRPQLIAVGALVAILLVKIAVIRPILNRETDLVLAGESAGGSLTHYFYIAADGLLIIGLIVLLVMVARTLIPVPAAPARAATPVPR